MLAALVLLVQAFVPGLHALQHRQQAAAEAANGRVHVCPLHPRPDARRAGAAGTGRESLAPGRTEIEECALGFALQRQQDWAPVLARPPQAVRPLAMGSFAPATARPPASCDCRNSLARGPPRP